MKTLLTNRPTGRAWAACAVTLFVAAAALLGSRTVLNFERTASAATPATDNPYLELYRLRIEQAEANHKRSLALVDLTQARLQRARRLIQSSAISAEEYDTAVSDAAVAAADVELTRKRIDEAKAYYRIIDGLVKRGASIPLCTYEME